jgi:uncharacterized damage-inducible protein DinB
VLICIIKNNINMTDMETMTKTTFATPTISTDLLLAQWIGHRKLTRRVLEVFPEDKLFTYTIGGMRTVAQLATEMLTLGAPGIRGVVTRKWDAYQDTEAMMKFTSKAALLAHWDNSIEEIKTLWPEITAERFFETDKFFGQWEGPIYWSIFYQMDNEIHHRAQVYVYLRSLGVEPPPFWDRA